MDQYHVPVLLQSACTYLNVRKGCRYIDATLGGGGHTGRILELGGRVLAIDQDQDALDNFTNSFEPALSSWKSLGRLVLVKANFAHIHEIAIENHWQPVAGVLFDLGVSLHQLIVPKRGFSFQKTGPLDMRMDQDLVPTADTLINNLGAKHLEQIFQDFADIKSQPLVQKIIANRPYQTTKQLADVIAHPDLTRRIFQALRIAVNDELTSIQVALESLPQILSSGSRIVVISFHSLEDKIVKDCFHKWQNQDLGEIITSKPITPNLEEIRTNPRAKSAKLRCFQKLV